MQSLKGSSSSFAALSRSSSHSPFLYTYFGTRTSVYSHVGYAKANVSIARQKWRCLSVECLREHWRAKEHHGDPSKTLAQRGTPSPAHLLSKPSDSRTRERRRSIPHLRSSPRLGLRPERHLPRRGNGMRCVGGAHGETAPRFFQSGGLHMTDTSIITIVFTITTGVVILAYMGRRLRLRIERRGIWLVWERSRKN